MTARLRVTIPDSRFLTPPQAAERLGVAPARIIAWIRAGKLRASNLGDGANASYLTNGCFAYQRSATDLPRSPSGRGILGFAAGTRLRMTVLDGPR